MKILTLSLALLFACFSNTVFAQEDNPETPFNDQQVMLLKKGRKYFNAYQAAYKEKFDKLPELNFEGAPLSGMDLRGMNFDNANFKEADLRGVMFGTKPAKTYAKYDNEGRLIGGVELIEPSTLRGANLAGADLGEFNLKVADLSLVDFENANLSMVDFTGAKFVKTNLRNANLSESSFIGCNLRKADLTLADMTDADVENCTFDRTILIRTKMDGLNVDDAVMKDVILNEKDLELDQKRQDQEEEGF